MNPYKRNFLTKSGDPLVDNFQAKMRTQAGFVQQSNEKLIGKNGELNAINKRDLMHKISALFDANDNQDIRSEVTATSRDRNVALGEAIADRSGEGFQAVGELLAEEIRITLGREGFARNTMVLQTLQKGQDPKVKIRRMDVTSLFATNDVNVIHSRIKQPFIYPKQFYLSAKVTIDDMEIEDTPGDLLEDKYQDGLQSILVGEDRRWRNLAFKASQISNTVYFFPSFTPLNFTQLKNEIEVWGGLPVQKAILAKDLWNDIIAHAEFIKWFTEVARHELILEGKIGSLLQVELITDGFRDPYLKVLEPGEIYMCSTPATFGVISEKKALMVEPTKGYNGDTTGSRLERGWIFEQIEAMTIANTRGCARGQKV